MRSFVKIQILMLLFADLPEVVNQIYVQKNILGFFGAAAYYFLAATLIFFFREFFKKIITRQSISAPLFYIIFGVIGLFIEWNFLGNVDSQVHGQIAMFTFWGALGLFPIIFTEDPVYPDLRKKLLIYVASYSVLFLVLGLFNSTLGLLVWILGCIFENYYFFVYFKRLKTTL